MVSSYYGNVANNTVFEIFIYLIIAINKRILDLIERKDKYKNINLS